MTRYGGATNDGSVFRIGLDGSGYRLVQSLGFASGTDAGERPEASLAFHDNRLYGTASSGGPLQGGTLFTIDLGPPFTPADLNQDGLVDVRDLILWNWAYGKSSAADADDDGDSGGSDFLIWQRFLGAQQSTANSVPEPSRWLAYLVGPALLIVKCSLRKLSFRNYVTVSRK